MKKISYYPGCTLTNKAKGLSDTARRCIQVLGIELVELEKWYCCQAEFSLRKDSLMSYLSSVRTLVSARKHSDKLVVLCSTCYYVLKRVNQLMEANEEKRKVVFDFLEEDYRGPVKIVHFLELIRDEVGFDKLKENVKTSLKELKVSAYYGCQLLRPSKDMAFDDPYAPTIFENFLAALGAEPTENPLKDECCGAFLTISTPEAVEDCVLKILNAASSRGAQTITTSCPLCNFNLDWTQAAICRKEEEFKKMPVFYFSELMALALGVEIPPEIWQEHVIDPRPFLKGKGYLSSNIQT